MNRLTIVSAVLLSLLATPLWAEKPISNVGKEGLGAVVSPGELKATPEMWFYDQAMRNYKDPQMAVRANAEFRAQQRMNRLASVRWFGFSNSRPRASSDPFHNDYSPQWVANPGYFPSRWNGIAQ